MSKEHDDTLRNHLQRAAVAERKRPRFIDDGKLIDSIQVACRILLRLTTRQEDDACIENSLTHHLSFSAHQELPAAQRATVP